MSIFQTIIGNRFFRYLTSFLINDDRRIFDSTVSLMALLPMEIIGILWTNLFASFYHDVLFYIFIFMIIMQLWFYFATSDIHVEDYLQDRQDYSKNQEKTILACISHVLYSIGSATMMSCALQHYFGMNIIYSILLSLILILVNIVLSNIMFAKEYSQNGILGYCFVSLFEHDVMFARFFQIEMYSLSHMINIITISIFGILFVKSILSNFFSKYFKTNVVILFEQYIIYVIMLLGKYITYVSLSLLLLAFVVTLGLGLVHEISQKEKIEIEEAIIAQEPKIVIDVWETKDIHLASLRQLLTKLGAKQPPPTSEELKPLWDAMEKLCQGWSPQTISKFKQQLGENEAYYADSWRVCHNDKCGQNDWKKIKANIYGHLLALQVLRITNLASLYYVLDLSKKEMFRVVFSIKYTYAMPYDSTLSTTAESLIKSLVNENLEYNTEKSTALDLFKSNMQVLQKCLCTDDHIEKVIAMPISRTQTITMFDRNERKLQYPDLSFSSQCFLLDCSFSDNLFEIVRWVNP